MAIPGYGNKRLYSFRRARLKQAGEHVTTGNPYYPTRQQDIISGERFVNDLTGPQAAEKARGDAQRQRDKISDLLAGQQLAAVQGMIKCQTTTYSAKLIPNVSISIVPFNFNRVFLFFSLVTIPNPANDTYAVFSFGPPKSGSVGRAGIALYSLVNAAGDVTRFLPNYLLNSSVIPIDEIFVTGNVQDTGVVVFEGIPIG